MSESLLNAYIHEVRLVSRFTGTCMSRRTSRDQGGRSFTIDLQLVHERSGSCTELNDADVDVDLVRVPLRTTSSSLLNVRVERGREFKRTR